MGGGTPEETYYIYDIAGNLAAEYGTGSNPAPDSDPETPAYPFADMLGSVRAVIECYAYLPFARMLGSSDNGRAALARIPHRVGRGGPESADCVIPPFPQCKPRAAD